MAADSIRLREAVRAALEQGFRREVTDSDEQEEVNLVLLEREAAQKKTKALADYALDILRQRRRP